MNIKKIKDNVKINISKGMVSIVEWNSFIDNIKSRLSKDIRVLERLIILDKKAAQVRAKNKPEEVREGLVSEIYKYDNNYNLSGGDLDLDAILKYIKYFNSGKIKKMNILANCLYRNIFYLDKNNKDLSFLKNIYNQLDDLKI